MRFPILPTVTFPDGEPAAARTPLGRRIFGQPSARYTGIFHMRHPTLITPREFDLSPFFDVIKPNPVARGSFDYSRIHWDDEEEPASPGDREAG